MPLPQHNLFYGLAKTATEEQIEYANSILDNLLTVTDSISGSGKTTWAVACAKYMWQLNPDKELYYFFAPVGEKAFGFTPGDLEEKESKYLIPLRDALKEIGDDPDKAIFSKKLKDEPEEDDEPFLSPKQSKKQKRKVTNTRYKESKTLPWIHATSHVFWRGGNIKGATVIIDEAQNWTKHELKKILTRCHDDCTIIVVGHQKQCDIDQKASGFPAYKAAAGTAPFAKIITLTKDFRGKLARWADEV
jgi:phosphate starvation-inducible PhoH-like protein